MTEARKKLNKTLIVAVVLAVFLLISVSYIALKELQTARINELMQTAQQGYNQGLIDSVVKLYQETENCNVATIFLGNITRSVVDISCLKSSAETPVNTSG